MALTAEQYQSILRSYKIRRNDAIRISQDHLAEIRENVPGYSDLEDQASDIAHDFRVKYMSDSSVSLDQMDLLLADISSKKKALLISNGYDPSYIEPSFSCPDCQDTGYIGNEKCHCFKQAEISLLYKQSNIREYFKNKNFAHLRTDIFEGQDLEHMNKAISICHNFIDNFDNDYRNLMFYGTVGTGKSFLSGCISYELLNSSHSVIYFSSTDLFDTFSENKFNSKNSESFDDSFAKDIFECELLVIDDLGTELSSQFVNSVLFTCLNERQLKQKATIISTNLSLSELQSRYSDRVFSRIVGTFEIIKLSGPDLRVKYRNKL